MAIIRAEHPEDMRLTPNEQISANRLGGVAIFHELSALSHRLSLDLSRPSERAICEHKLWESRGRSVATGASWDECLAAAMRRMGVRFSDSGAAKRDAALLVFRERPD